MIRRRVRFTETAQKQVRREKAWWLENRIHTEVFASEFEEAVQLLAILPGAGSPYTKSPGRGVRRIYLRKVAAHLYYTFDDQQVVVRAVWGARRRRGPKFKR